MPDALIQLFLPAECLTCRRLLAYQVSDDLLCDVCRSRLRPVRPPWCERCGQPEPHFGPCRLCREWPSAFLSARSAVWLDDEARTAVHALKYGGLARLATDLAIAMARVLPVPPRGAGLVPVPLAARRQHARGYNQARMLAEALAVRWQRPVYPELLVRRRETPSQTALTPAGRLANVAGAFALRNADCGSRIGRRTADSAMRGPQSPIVLVDDVFTTGATLAEAARALAAAGFTEVSAVTFGRASIPDFI